MMETYRSGREGSVFFEKTPDQKHDTTNNYKGGEIRGVGGVNEAFFLDAGYTHENKKYASQPISFGIALLMIPVGLKKTKNPKIHRR
jgi:hypothetical protein